MRRFLAFLFALALICAFTCAQGWLKNEDRTGKYDSDTVFEIGRFQNFNGVEIKGIFDAVTRMMLL